jgi:hypothetical protein
MKYIKLNILILLIGAVFVQCKLDKDDNSNNDVIDYSGIYCLNVNNMEMTIVQSGNDVTFTVQRDILLNGTGTITGDTLMLTATTYGSETFTSHLTFSENEQSLSGPFQVEDTDGKLTLEGILLGNKGACAKYDIELNGIPKFIEKDFTQLSKIDMISKFRSGFGHSYTDGSEDCRSMKHYYNPYERYRKNLEVEIYSPVTGTIVSIMNDFEGSNTDLLGLKNKEIHIKPDEQPAFIFDIFHCELVSSDIVTGKKVQAGELLGFATMYYETWDEYVTSFDIAVWVNTPSGIRLVPYSDTMKDVVFKNYISRGVFSRQDFIITQESRDANPLECNGEQFVSNDENPNDWVILNSP